MDGVTILNTVEKGGFSIWGLIVFVLCAVDESYNKTKFLNLLNYKHLLMTSAQVMELTEKEQNIFMFEILYNIYKIIKIEKKI